MFTAFPIEASRRRLECGDASPLSDWATRRPATKRGHVRAFQIIVSSLVAYLIFLSLPAAAQSSPPPATYTRSFVNDVPNQPLVTVTVTGAVSVACFTIEEILPGPATAISVSGDGVYLPAKNVIRWGPFFNIVATNVSYRLSGLPANYPVNGGAWMDGHWLFSPGATLVTVLPAGGSGNGVLPSPPPQVATPVFTPPSGAGVPTSVTITDATPGAVIFYTLDGSLPTQSSTLYSGPVPLASSSVLRAAAFTNGWAPSAAVAAFYGQQTVSVNAQVTRNVSGNATLAPVVTLNVTPGVGVQCVAVTESLPPGVGATGISSGGNYIASNNVVLWGPYLGTNAQVLSYQAVGLPGIYPVRASWSVDGVSASEVAGTNLVIAVSGANGTLPTPPPQVATPVFTPPGGSIVPVSVTITDATPGTTIYYTLDGSPPTQSSTLYTAPIPLSSSGLVRAAAFTNGWAPGAAVAFYGSAVSANAQVIRNVSGNATAAPMVTLNLTPGVGAQCVAVTETLPPGVGATGISSGGNYIASNNVVLWGPFLGTNAQVLSYQAVGLPGIYPVRASWSVDGVTGSETAGTNLVIALSGVNGTVPLPPPQVATPVLLPAMATNLPVSVTITDATPGAVIYYTLNGSLPTPGSTLYTGPVPLASAGVLRAAAFTNGWTPSVAVVGVYSTPPTTNSVSATHSVFGNGTFMPVVNLTATPQGPVSCYAVVEMIPQGLTPSGLSGDGIWDSAHGAIHWGPYFDNQPRAFSYSVSGLSGLYPVSGLVSFDGYSQSTGTTIVQINNSVTSLPIVTMLFSNIVRNANGSVTLNIASQPNVTNRVWANTNLALPAGWQPIFTNPATPANGLWQFVDLNASNYPMRFYRFSTP